MEWSLLAGLSDEDQRTVVALARRRRFGRGEIIFHEGDPGDAMHLLAKGRVAIRVTTPLGDIATLLVLGVGDHFGEMAVISSAPRNATAVALEPTETLSIHRAQFEELRQRHREVDRILLEAAIAEVRRLSHQLLEALYVPVDKRVVRRLLDLVAVYRVEGEEPIIIPLTQEDLAQMAGTTRPTANKVLRAAEEAGVLAISRGRIDVIDTRALAKRAR
jgi:CRP-like cAMP-binding protein